MSPGDASSWGRYPKLEPTEIVPLWHRNQKLPSAGTLKSLPRGSGRSYGDQGLIEGGRLLTTGGLDRFIAFESETGRLTCETGVTLGEVLDLTVPRGWFLPVLPGTRHVTVGGAIANDIHGKNHHSAGSFGCHVETLTLCRSDGTTLQCGREENAGLFSATIAGMGLTGAVTTATLQLKRIASDRIKIRSIRFANLYEFFNLSELLSGEYEYTVAWIDCLARGSSLGRGHFIAADHAHEGRADPPRRNSRNMPFTPPFSLVNRASLRVFNSVYYHRQIRREREFDSHYSPYFFPLDGIEHWNRMYGPRGFIQYQCAIPKGPDTQAHIARMLDAISESGMGSFLAVLKTFGAKKSPGMLSFPVEGATLALDFPCTADDRLPELCEVLDEILLESGGRLYAAKDAMTRHRELIAPATALARFRPHIDNGCSSAMATRLGIIA